MPSPTTARGLLGNFLHGADPTAADQPALPPPVRFPTSLSLQATLAAGDGTGGCRSLQDGRGWGGEGRQPKQGRTGNYSRHVGGGDIDDGGDKDNEDGGGTAETIG